MKSTTKFKISLVVILYIIFTTIITIESLKMTGKLIGILTAFILSMAALGTMIFIMIKEKKEKDNEDN